MIEFTALGLIAIEFIAAELIVVVGICLLVTTLNPHIADDNDSAAFRLSADHSILTPHCSVACNENTSKEMQIRKIQGISTSSLLPRHNSTYIQASPCPASGLPNRHRRLLDELDLVECVLTA